MRKEKNIIRLVSWMLLLTFMSAYLIKDFHSHHSEDDTVQHAGQQCDDSHIDTKCSICDFNFCKSEAPRILTYNPVLAFTISTPYIITVQTVYRNVLSVNSHSPPTKA